MCCFAQKVEDVSDTRIFSRLTEAGNQFLVYQMRFRSKTPNAMILPLPIALPAREEAVRFQSLQDYPDFFDDLNRGFPHLPKRQPYPSVAARAVDSKSAAPLIVHEVGGFIASFVPQVDDFERLDPQFSIPKEQWAQIPLYSDFGFAVIQLKELEGSVHPIAMEYPTRWSDRHFFPTVHIHDGQVHDQELFHHRLYLQDAAWDKLVSDYQGPDHRDPSTGWVRSKNAAQYFCGYARTEGIIEPSGLVHRMSMEGMFANRDVIPVSTLTGRQPVSQKSWEFTRWGLGATTILAGTSWLFWRRNQMRSKATKFGATDTNGDA